MKSQRNGEVRAKRILDGNPYKLNRFGVLELPGLPAMPLAGLTASEATKRLGGRPRPQQLFREADAAALDGVRRGGTEAVRLRSVRGVSEHLCAGLRYSSAGGLYQWGPGDTLVVQLYGNEPRTYELTVERDGRINFPKLGPIAVSNMTFDAARASHRGTSGAPAYRHPCQRDHGRLFDQFAFSCWAMLRSRARIR